MRSSSKNKTEFGRYLDEAICEAGIKKADVAARIGVTPQAVNGWVRTGHISVFNFCRLAEIVDLDIMDALNTLK